MGWTLHLQPIRNPWADPALLTGGRALYVAQAFEGKCRSLLRFGYLAQGVGSDPIASLEDLIARLPRDQLLGPTLTSLASLLPEAHEHREVLSSAREARNYIAHESVLFGIHSQGWEELAERMAELRRQVRILVDGDNLVSTWSHHFHERGQPTPTELKEAYPLEAGSNSFAGVGQPCALVYWQAQAKICQQNILAAKKHIRRLDVAVGNPGCVEQLESERNPIDQPQTLHHVRILRHGDHQTLQRALRIPRHTRGLQRAVRAGKRQ